MKCTVLAGDMELWTFNGLDYFQILKIILINDVADSDIYNPVLFHYYVHMIGLSAAFLETVTCVVRNQVSPAKMNLEGLQIPHLLYQVHGYMENKDGRYCLMFPYHTTEWSISLKCLRVSRNFYELSHRQ